MGLTRLTHKRESGMKSGYWTPNRKEELVERLAEYEDLEEQNRLLKLPCAVGDMVYVLRLDNTAYMMNNEKVWEIVEDKFEIFHFDSIGKTVFLTREAAEAALEELRRGKHERAGKDLDSG